MWERMAWFMLGLALGLALTWWRWRMALELESRTREWKASAVSMTDLLTRLDEAIGSLANIVRVHLKATTPAPLREAIARQVGEVAPPKPEAGWEAPIPSFAPEPSQKPKPSDMRER